MKNKSVWILVLGIIFITAGVGGYVFAQDDTNSTVNNRINGYNENTDFINNGYFEMGSMMSGYYRNTGTSTNEDVYPVDELTDAVEQYISGYDTELVVSDIFVFADSEYYYSIIEKDTGKGAMELLVNPYTKAIFPEYGPNMMWNLKYGMHQSGYMGRGMMGYYYDEDDEYYSNDFSDQNDLTYEEAYNNAVEYLADNGSELSVGDEYHDFYGYYTFHVNKSGETVGMLSVNGFTGTVWYHDWHGELVDIIEGHE